MTGISWWAQLVFPLCGAVGREVRGGWGLGGTGTSLVAVSGTATPHCGSTTVTVMSDVCQENTGGAPAQEGETQRGEGRQTAAQQSCPLRHHQPRLRPFHANPARAPWHRAPARVLLPREGPGGGDRPAGLSPQPLRLSSPPHSHRADLARAGARQQLSGNQTYSSASSPHGLWLRSELVKY